MAFKMKGSPMYRNFGIGSPAKQAKPDVEGEKKVMEKRKKAIEDHRKNAPKTTNTQEQADQLNQMDADNVAAYNTSADSIQGVHNTWNKHVEKQNAIIDSTNTANRDAFDKYMEENKKKSPNKQTISSVSDSLQNLPNPAAEKLRKEYEEALKKLQKEAQEKLDANTDSTNQSNSDVLNKRADQIQQNVSPKEFNKQVKDFNKKNSPNKQRDLGGTKSGKGNVFTKRGRTQKKINAERAETAKLKEEHIAENKRSTYFATKDHEARMIRKQLKNRPKTVVMKGDKDVTDQYR
jgi:hypothetical protein